MSITQGAFISVGDVGAVEGGVGGAATTMFADTQ